MPQFDFKLPDIGEGVSEGEIVEWHVAEGDKVAEDDPMVEVTTDKASVTIGAPRAGTIRELRYAVGQTAKVGQVIVVIDTQLGATDEPPTEPKQDATEPQKELAATAVGDIRDGLPGSTFFSQPRAARSNGNGQGQGQGNGGRAPEATTAPRVREPAPAAKRGLPATQGGLQTVEFFQAKPLATPATRRLARTMQIDLRQVRPSGPHGRVTKKDLLAFADRAPTKTAIEAGPREERKPFVGIRRRIAERMQQSKNTAAHFTFVEECDVGRLVEIRDRMAPAAAEHGVKLSFLPFIVKAVVEALKKHATLNSALDEATNELVYRKYYHIGIAAATERGLMVPVVRDADRRSLLDIAQEIQRLGEGARNGSLSPQELSGSTFTITSLGKQGGLFATPVLNFPEVGILGVHRIKERPVVRDGQIVIGQIMLLSLSFDHRIVDGHVGAAFAYDVIELLESPERLFLKLA